MSDELLNNDLLLNKDLDVEGHIRSPKATDEPADESKNEDDEVEGHVRHANVRHDNVRHD